MFAADQMRYGALVLAAIFGGPGVFYSIESSLDETFALNGIFYLGVALALLWSAQVKKPVPARRKLPPDKRR